jgi:hypothetical protein
VLALHDMPPSGQQGRQLRLVLRALGHHRQTAGVAVEELAGRALVERAAGVDQHEPVTHLLQLAEIVGGHQDRPSGAGQAAHERPHLSHPLGIEPVGGLVEDEQLGVAQQGGGDAQPLFHP